MVVKCIRKNNLYYSQSDTIIGTVATISKENKNSEITRLYHMHLRHSGEKTLQNLERQGLLKGAKTSEMKSSQR